MVLGDYTDIWDENKEQIELISGKKMIKHSKDFMKIRFESDDDLPISKIINIPVCVIIIRGFFEEDSKYNLKFCYMVVFMSMKKVQILQLCKVLITM